MPTVSMPDGSVVEFPDGMSDAQINSALAGWKPTGTGVTAVAAAPGAVHKRIHHGAEGQEDRQGDVIRPE